MLPDCIGDDEWRLCESPEDTLTECVTRCWVKTGAIWTVLHPSQQISGIRIYISIYNMADNYLGYFLFLSCYIFNGVNCPNLIYFSCIKYVHLIYWIVLNCSPIVWQHWWKVYTLLDKEMNIKCEAPSVMVLSYWSDVYNPLSYTLSHN